jgi:hypothetical protein
MRWQNSNPGNLQNLINNPENISAKIRLKLYTMTRYARWVTIAAKFRKFAAIKTPLNPENYRKKSENF